MRLFALLLVLMSPVWAAGSPTGSFEENGKRLEVWAHSGKVELRLFKDSDYASVEFSPDQWDAFKQHYAGAWLQAERLRQGNSVKVAAVKDLEIYAVHTADWGTAVRLALPDGKEAYISKKNRSSFGKTMVAVDQALR